MTANTDNDYDLFTLLKLPEDPTTHQRTDPLTNEKFLISDVRSVRRVQKQYDLLINKIKQNRVRSVKIEASELENNKYISVSSKLFSKAINKPIKENDKAILASSMRLSNSQG